MTQFNEDIKYYIKASYPCIYVVAREEWRALKEIENVCAEEKIPHHSWTYTNGLDYKLGSSPGRLNQPKLKEPDDFIKDRIMSADDAVYSIINFHFFLDNPEMIQRIKDVIQIGKAKGQVLVFISNVWKVPQELVNDITRMDFSLPDKELLNKRIDYVINSNVKIKEKISSLDKNEREKITEAALGMSTWEFENTLFLSFLKTGKIDVQFISKEKANTVAKSGILEFYPPTVNMNDVGGLNNLKDWLKARKKIFTAEAREYGLPNLKGVLLVGIPGTGKSLASKAIASEWGIPLIRFDLGKLFAGLVGASEERTRQALELAEAVAPCVTGDTFITLGNGNLIKVEELYSKFNIGERVIAVNENTLEQYSVPLLNVLKRGIKYTLKINTVGGSITVTLDHKILTDKGWKTASNIIKGDWIYYPTLPVNRRDNLPFNFIMPEKVEEKQPNYYRYGRGGWTDSYLNVPVSISEEVAELLGYIDSDGYITARGRVGFTNSNPLLLDRFEYLIKNLFQLIPTRIKNGNMGETFSFINDKNDVIEITSKLQNYLSYVNNKLLCRVLKILRNNILKFEYSYLLAAYIRAFINGDGYISKRKEYSSFKIVISQAKLENKQLIINILRRLGIISHFNRKNCEITGSQAKALLDILIQAPGPIGDKIDKVKLNSILHWRHRNGRTIRKANNGNYTYVTSVESGGNREVYDLCCDTVHTYISNGMVSHNCVLWIDEIEKGMAGLGNSGNTDSGVTSRVFGTILSWMQEKKRPVFMVATANQIQNLPPELMRAGRWDEMFFIDLPSKKEREDILKIHINKKGRDIEKFDIEKIAQETDKFSGAELENVVIKAMTQAFYEDREFNTEDLLCAVNQTVPLAETRKEEIDYLRNWAKERAISASKETVPLKEETGRKIRL